MKIIYVLSVKSRGDVDVKISIPIKNITGESKFTRDSDFIVRFKRTLFVLGALFVFASSRKRKGKNSKAVGEINDLQKVSLCTVY